MPEEGDSSASSSGSNSPGVGVSESDILVAAASSSSDPRQQKEDAKEIVVGKGYTWKDWSLVRGRDCLYIWSEAAALELSNVSNGWFSFILDGKLATLPTENWAIHYTRRA